MDTHMNSGLWRQNQVAIWQIRVKRVVQGIRSDVWVNKGWRNFSDLMPIPHILLQNWNSVSWTLAGANKPSMFGGHRLWKSVEFDLIVDVFCFANFPIILSFHLSFMHWPTLSRIANKRDCCWSKIKGKWWHKRKSLNVNPPYWRKSPIDVNPSYWRLPGDGSACVSAKEHSAMNPISTCNVGEKLRK